jgi:hypothetical protein
MDEESHPATDKKLRQAGLLAVGVTLTILLPFFSVAADPAPTPAPESPLDQGGLMDQSTPAAESPSPAPSPGADLQAPADGSSSTVFLRDPSADNGNSGAVPRQTIFPPPDSAVQIATSISQQGGSNGESLFNGLGGVPNPLSARYLSPTFDRRLGFFVGGAWIEPTLGVGAVYQAERGSAGSGNQTSEYATISPSVSVILGTREVGRFLIAQYEGVVSLGQTSGMGTYDQTLNVDGTYTMPKLSVSGGLEASELSGADQDFSGEDVSRLLISLTAGAIYQYSDLTTLNFTLSAPLRLYEEGDNSEGINSQTLLKYAYSPMTTVGAGFGLGTVVVGSETQVFEQALLDLEYTPDPKLSAAATVGYEFRQTDAGEENTPIFQLALTWRPDEGTAFVLSGEREVSPSAALVTTNFITTSASVSASQRIGRYVNVSGTFGYNDDSYEQAGAESAYGRDEQYYLVQAAVTAQLNLHWQLVLNASYSYLSSSGGVPNVAQSLRDKLLLYGVSTGNTRTLLSSVQMLYAF